MMRREHGTPIPNRHRERASGPSDITMYQMEPAEVERYLREKYGARVFSPAPQKPPVGADFGVRKTGRKKASK
ncbi:hypothetical protein [Alicyclobacillus sendaiensis]|uniref:hypothetical protein n=1 Tax=Alicyclobacillus sendaiensis TaxID=192387 RepID=UPI0026F42426|nr:hypothetical protein [Alicyclobacillus sendaiensis]